MRSLLASLLIAVPACVGVAGCGFFEGIIFTALDDGGGSGGGGVSGGDGGVRRSDGGAPLDLHIPMGDMAMFPSGACDATHACPTGQRCFGAVCVADNGSCTLDSDCENDSYCDCTAGGGGDAGACMGGVCIPWGLGPKGAFDPGCVSQGFSAKAFVAPKLKCQWAGGPTLTIPIVADLDGDKQPEIIFQSYSTGFTALHGKDCSVMWTKDFDFADSNQSQLAVADLDADGVPEIIGINSADKVVVFDNKGNLLATSPTALSATYPSSPQDWGGPAIADVDNAAPPEIIVAGQVVRYVKGQGISVLFTKKCDVPQFGPISVVADLDGDGKPEVICGKEIYDGTSGADKTPSTLKGLSGPGAFPAIGDFNADGKPDIVLVQSEEDNQQVSVFDYANNKFIFGPYPVPMGWGGPPTVADFDGDGKPEFASAGHDFYYVFSLKCVGASKPAACDPTTNYGVLWKKATQDHSSGSTGSSVFDFNGDGIAEVVYRDECWLRVYNGPDGKTVFAATVTSATALELPVVADVDNDGHADIVVTSDNVGAGCPNSPEADTQAPWTGATTGVLVFQDPMNRWLPSRGLWNEHSYHITNVNDDLTIPTTEADNWLTWNNYRQNVQGIEKTTMAQPDLTGQPGLNIETGQDDCAISWKLRANVCNRGSSKAPAGIPGTFYIGDPRVAGAKLICTGYTMMALPPGECAEVDCDFATPPTGAIDLWFRSDDDGKGGMPPTAECDDKNDLLHTPGAECGGIG